MKSIIIFKKTFVTGRDPKYIVNVLDLKGELVQNFNCEHLTKTAATIKAELQINRKYTQMAYIQSGSKFKLFLP